MKTKTTLPTLHSCSFYELVDILKYLSLDIDYVEFLETTGLSDNQLCDSDELVISLGSSNEKLVEFLQNLDDPEYILINQA